MTRSHTYRREHTWITAWVLGVVVLIVFAVAFMANQSERFLGAQELPFFACDRFELLPEPGVDGNSGNPACVLTAGTDFRPTSAQF